MVRNHSRLPLLTATRLDQDNAAVAERAVGELAVGEALGLVLGGGEQTQRALETTERKGLLRQPRQPEVSLRCAHSILAGLAPAAFEFHELQNLVLSLLRERPERL